MARASAPTSKRPKLGQNFLADQSAAAKIVAALGEIGSATVIEIGPGQAMLTSILAKSAGRLIAIELDRVLAAQLSLKFARKPNVEIIEADVLTVDIANIIKRKPDAILHLPQAEKAKVVGNLPYYITSDILLAVNNQPAKLYRSGTTQARFEREVDVIEGTNTVTIQATAVNSASTTKSYTFEIAAAQRIFSTPEGALQRAAAHHGAAIRRVGHLR